MNKIRLCILFFLLFQYVEAQKIIDKYGAIVQSDTSKKHIYLCFTGHDFDDGFNHVLTVLKNKNIKASFFLTGDFIRNHKSLVKTIANRGHYIGAHSNKHLLYCDWVIRDSLLHTSKKIKRDIKRNLKQLKALGIHPKYFMPPYEWYNTEVVEIAKALNQTTINFSYGTRSNADYTKPNMKNYLSSDTILKSIYGYEKENGLNGFHLLIHPGVSPLRKDKLYLQLEGLIDKLENKGYSFVAFR